VTTPYTEALQWISKHPGTGSASSLAKLILSLWNQDCSYSFRECVGNLDGNLSALAVRMVAHFEQHGEDAELVNVGHNVCERFPRLWDMAKAMTYARQSIREEWRRADEEASART
jgi:hypothetical protein